ncbi:MAG: VOC family protein [Gammaproteobacteria bacterium]|nr:VOC family protein [Gammaproteobacteria bacterium]
MSGIHHINFIVRDLEAAVPVWERLLNQPVTSRDRLDGRGVDIARFQLGSTWLVLAQPTEPDTVPGRFLAEHGEGFFLLSLGVESLDDAVERIGEDWFDGPTRIGLDNWQVRDIDRARTCGAQIQLAEDSASSSE